MDINSKKTLYDLYLEAKPYDEDDPILECLDGQDYFRMLKTIKKELDEKNNN